MKQGILKIAIIGLIGLSQTVAAAPFTDEDINNSFYPYNDWTPTADGYTPGEIIDQSNVDQFQEIFDEALFKFVKDGWVTIRTAPTTDFPLSEDYVEATRKYTGDVSLAENGTLNNFVAGRAFPQEPQADDPNAGQKLVWNYQYGFNSGDSETISPFWWTFRNVKTGKVERQLKFEWHFMNYSHRVTFDPKPAFEDNPGGIYRGIYGIVKEPFDLANTQILIHRYEDGTKRDNAWLYVGFQRRVRRLAAGQITDSFLGSDLMVEDFEGYNGKVTDYTWEYAGTRNILMPFINHSEMELSNFPENDPDGYKFIDVEGQGNCFPKVTYQLRKSYTLIGRPKNPNHPIGKRVINLDAQTMVMSSLVTYDRKGDMWKWFPITKANADDHLPINKGKGVPIEDFAVVIDIQANHCTTLQFKSQITDEDNQPKLFSVQNLRKAGR